MDSRLIVSVDYYEPYDNFIYTNTVEIDSCDLNEFIESQIKKKMPNRSIKDYKLFVLHEVK